MPAQTVLDPAPDAPRRPVIEIRIPHPVRRPVALLAATAAPPAGVPADTYGWDTAFAVRLPDVNAAIRKAGSSPKAFDFQSADGSCGVRGTFGTWQLCRGGDGALPHFALPIPAAAVKWGGASAAFTDVVATVELSLGFFPLPSPHLPPGTETKLKPKAGGADPSAEPVASVLRLTAAGKPLDSLEAGLLRAGLQEWLNAHLQEFDHVFSAVNLNRAVDRGAFAWLNPTDTGYAYVNGPTDADCLFGVLCTTGGRPAAKLASQLSPAAVPAKSRAGFLISRSRFLDQMVLPALPGAFPGSRPQDFGLSADGAAVVSRSPLSMKAVNHGGKDYHPVIRELSVRVLGDEIEVSLLITVDIDPALGTSAWVSYTGHKRLKLATKADGSQTLTYEDSRPAATDHWTQTTAEGQTLQLVLAIVLAVVALILVIVTDGVILLVGLIVLAILGVMLTAVPQLIASAVGKRIDDLPALGALAEKATAPVRWAGASDFRLDWAGLNGSLQLGGDPCFTH